MDEDIRAAMRRQAGFCRAMNAPIVARVCDALADALDAGSETGRRTLDWPNDAITDALPLRLIGGFHALALAGDPDATRLFAPDTDVAQTRHPAAGLLACHDATLLPWLAGPPQTNEVGRAAPLMLGLMAIARRFPHPMHLLEIGASAGLNLLIPHFGFDLGGVRIGPADAPILLRPDGRGPPPPPAHPPPRHLDRSTTLTASLRAHPRKPDRHPPIPSCQRRLASPARAPAARPTRQ